MNFKIKTSHKWYPTWCLADLTPKEQAEFDYVTEEERNDGVGRFVRYKGVVYDLNEFQVTKGRHLALGGIEGLKEWDGYQSDSFFSGVVCRWGRDDEVQMGTYFA